MESVLKQNVNKEIIVVNDGSTDHTAKILKRYEKLPYITVITKKNGGVSAARNTGIKAAAGDYIYFADCDDVIMEHAVEKLLIAAKKYDADIAVGNYVYYDEETGCFKEPGNYLEEKVYKKEDAKEFMHWTCLMSIRMIKKDLIEKHGFAFPTDLKMGEDAHFHFMTFAGAKTVVSISDTIYEYHTHEGSACRTYDKRVLKVDSLFNSVEDGLKKMGREDLLDELKKDRAFWYTDHLRNVMKYPKKEDRKAMFDLFIRTYPSMNGKKFCCGDPEVDKAFLSFVKTRRIRESSIVSACFRIIRTVFLKVKKIASKVIRKNNTVLS